MTRPFSQFLRLVWIDYRLELGTFNRADIAAAFSMSIEQASLDLKAYRAEHSQCIEYDQSFKAYRRPALARPAYPQHLRLQVSMAVRAINIYRSRGSIS